MINKFKVIDLLCGAGGTGDIDCDYHCDLYELQAAVKLVGLNDAADMLALMADGK